MGFAERLKALREEKEMTLAEIANKVGVSEATVQRWESGNIKQVRYGRLDKLADVLGTTPAHLMGYDEPVIQRGEPQADPLAAQFTEMFMRLSAEQRLEIVSTMLRMIG